MIRLILLSFLFLLSLLAVFRAPASLLWYVAILVTEVSWIFLGLVFLLLVWRFGTASYPLATTLLAIGSAVLYSLPYWQAWRLQKRLQIEFAEAFASPQ